MTKNRGVWRNDARSAVLRLLQIFRLLWSHVKCHLHQWKHIWRCSGETQSAQTQTYVRSPCLKEGMHYGKTRRVWTGRRSRPIAHQLANSGKSFHLSESISHLNNRTGISIPVLADITVIIRIKWDHLCKNAFLNLKILHKYEEYEADSSK